MPSIDCRTVAYTYPHARKPALMDFSVSCSGASVYAVLGPNGGGKSTFLQMCAGLLKPDSGTIEVSERPAFLPQQERIAFAFSVLEYVLFGRAPHIPFLHVPTSSDEERVLSALSALGIEHLAKKRITELSGGELQLVRFARILVQESSIYLLDEPTDMLDPAHSVQIAKLLAREKEQGRLILMATHDLMFAQECADYIIMIKNGILQCCSNSGACLTEDRLSLLFDVPMKQRSTFLPAVF